MATAEQSYPFWPNLRPGTGSGTTNIASGTMMIWTTPTAPTGWYLCNGQAVSRTSNAVLFNAIGTTYGPGDGSSTFNLPNLNDRFAIGVGSNALASTGGSATVALSYENMPLHSHAITDNGHTHTDAGHTHTYSAITSRSFTGIGGGTAYEANMEITTGTDLASAVLNSATTGITVQTTGQSQPFSVLNPFLALYFIIKA